MHSSNGGFKSNDVGDTEVGICIAIDGSNLREGGGVTHICELLRYADPARHGFDRIVLWSVPETLARLPDRPWLVKRSTVECRSGWVGRVLWQWLTLPKLLLEVGCDVLFAPGGILISGYRPAVTMSRNMLPFDGDEVARYGVSKRRLRLILLRFLQTRSFLRADGLIFLTDYARTTVLNSVARVQGEIVTIPHGVSSDFRVERVVHRTIDAASAGDPFRLIYVSHASPYKHQWMVVEAMAQIRSRTGWPLALDMVGPRSVFDSVVRIESAILKHDPKGEWARFHGPLEREEIQQRLALADAAVFASSCENMPNVLLEKMAAGVPIACARCGPMPEVLMDGGVYFDPERPEDIARALEDLIGDVALRKRCSERASERACCFSWRKCSDETFLFLAQVVEKYRASSSKRDGVAAR